MTEIDRVPHLVCEDRGVVREIGVTDPTLLGIDDNPALSDDPGFFVSPFRTRDAKHSRGSAKELLHDPRIGVIDDINAAAILSCDDLPRCSCGVYIGQSDRSKVADDLSLKRRCRYVRPLLCCERNDLISLFVRNRSAGGWRNDLERTVIGVDLERRRDVPTERDPLLRGTKSKRRDE